MHMWDQHAFADWGVASKSIDWSQQEGRLMEDTSLRGASPNTLLEDIALGFVSGNLDDFPVPDRLDILGLDFSVQSLGLIDRYLEEVRQHFSRKRLKGQSIYDAVPASSEYVLLLRLGAYLGEVIRKHSTNTVEWITHADVLRLSADYAVWLGDKPTLSTAFALQNTNIGLTMPLNKVFKFLVNGSEDSLESYARVAIGKNIESLPR